MKTLIKVKLQVEGLHMWSDCPIEEVDFLKNLHRHIFFITCEKEVTHNDRDIEIIMFKRRILDFLDIYFSDYYECLNFENMSCEMIAELLLKEFELESCEVLEDNENGSIVKK